MLYDSIQAARSLISFIKAIGLWSYKGQRFHPLYKFYGWSLHTVFTFVLIFGMYANAAQKDNIDDITDALYMAFTETVLFVKVVNMLTISQQVVDFLAIIQQHTEGHPANPKELQMMEGRQSSFKRLSTAYISSAVIVLIITDVVPFLDDEYKLPFPCWIPFEYRNPEKFLYAYSYIAVAMSITALTNTIIDLVQAFLLFKLTSLYKLIAMRLESLENDVEGLTRIIRLHNFTERMVMKCQDIISVPVFAQTVMSAFILCLTVYQLQKISLLNDTANFIALLMFAMIMALQIFFPCYFGNEVTISASELTGAVYNSNWVELPAESRKLIFVYMEYLKRPIQLRAGQFFRIGIAVFTKTMNNAYSLFALLLNIKS